MAVLPGFARLPGTARNYRGPDGKKYNRREYEKLVTAAEARTKITPQRAARETAARRQYARLLNAAAKLDRDAGGKGNKAALRGSAEFKRNVRDLRAKGKSTATLVKKRDALKRLGLRNKIPDWIPPGLSDQYKRGKIKRARDLKRYGFTKLPAAA